MPPPMPVELDIEQPAMLVAYLRETGRLAPGQNASCATLPGGVSNRTVRVILPAGEAWVLKQALTKLRVKEDWFSDPARAQREALALRWLEKLAPAGSVPAFVFEDARHHLLAMRAVPEPHENWKQQLLRGEVDPALVAQFGRILGLVHSRSHQRASELRQDFDDRSPFESLRLQPYYRVTAGRHPALADFYERLIADTLAVRWALVHGDYSPKNALVREGRLVLLDFEVTHFGDPAFDLGFALTHFLSKAHHLPPPRGRFLEAAQGFWEAYREAVSESDRAPELESRAVRHTLGCLLARVDGRSPLEYLGPAEQQRQREIVSGLARRPDGTLPELIASFGALLDAAA